MHYLIWLIPLFFHLCILFHLLFCISIFFFFMYLCVYLFTYFPKPEQGVFYVTGGDAGTRVYQSLCHCYLYCKSFILSVCLSACLLIIEIYALIHLFVCLCVCMYVCLSTHLDTVLYLLTYFYRPCPQYLFRHSIKKKKYKEYDRKLTQWYFAELYKYDVAKRWWCKSLAAQEHNTHLVTNEAAGAWALTRWGESWHWPQWLQSCDVMLASPRCWL